MFGSSRVSSAAAAAFAISVASGGAWAEENASVLAAATALILEESATSETDLAEAVDALRAAIEAYERRNLDGFIATLSESLEGALGQRGTEEVSAELNARLAAAASAIFSAPDQQIEPGAVAAIASELQMALAAGVTDDATNAELRQVVEGLAGLRGTLITWEATFPNAAIQQRSTDLGDLLNAPRPQLTAGSLAALGDLRDQIESLIEDDIRTGVNVVSAHIGRIGGPEACDVSLEVRGICQGDRTCALTEPQLNGLCGGEFAPLVTGRDRAVTLQYQCLSGSPGAWSELFSTPGGVQHGVAPITAHLRTPTDQIQCALE